MVVREKIRADSLQPGTSVLPLLGRSPLINGDRLIPLLTFGNQTIGFISVTQKNIFKQSRYLSYTNVDGVKVFRLKGSPAEKMLSLLNEEFQKKGHFQSEDDADDLPAVFPSLGKELVCYVPRQLAEMIGAKTSRIVLIAHMGRDRNLSLIMGRRIRTAVKNPYKLQCLLSFNHSALSITREELAEVAYKALDLQPAYYSKLRSVGIYPSMLAINKGYERTSTHIYELDLTDLDTFKPRCSSFMEQFETILVKTLLNSCLAEMICGHDLLPVLSFCFRHGVITPETDENYEQLTQLLSYDIVNTFPFKK